MSKSLLLCLFIFFAVRNFAQDAYSRVTIDSRFGIKVPYIINDKRVANENDDTRHKPEDDINPNLISTPVSSFSSYFDDRLLGSFWQELRQVSPRTDAVEKYSDDHIIRSTSVNKSYAYLFKMMYGDSFDLTIQQSSVITDTSTNKQTAELLYKARSPKAQGFLYISFTIHSDRTIILEKISFYPFDHSLNSFISNLCEKDLTLIETQQSSVLIDSIIHYADADKIKQVKGVKGKLNTIKLLSKTLFTYRLFMEKGEIWVMGVFDTDKTNEHLNIAYRLVNKQFKPAFIEVLRN